MSTQLPSQSDDALLRRLGALQLQALIDASGPAAGANVGLGLVFVLLSLPFVPRLEAIAWYGAVLMVSLLRFATARRLHVTQPQDLRRGLGLISYVALLTGAVWGFIGARYMVPSQPALFALALICVVAVVGTSGISMGIHPRSYLLFSAGAVVPIAISQAFIVPGGDWRLALVMSMYLPGAKVLATQQAQRLRRRIEIEMENEALSEAVVIERDLALKAQREAERANLSKSQFLAAASHDLRQPLHAQAMLVGALDAARDMATVRHIAGTLERSGQALHEILDVLLDISKIDAGAVEPEFAVIPLQPLLERIRDQFAPYARDKGLDLRLAPTSIWVRSDPRMLQRVVSNLVQNAVRYTDHGRVLVGYHRSRRAIGVWDTGPGIPPSQRERIFNEYVQLDNPERNRTKGLGLGLSIVDRLCRLLDHALDLRSEVGVGSVFHVGLDSISPVPTPLEAPSSNWSVDWHGKHLLFIDDEDTQRQAFTELARSWGARVTAVAEEGAAHPAIRDDATGIVAIVVDYRLGGSSYGLAVAERLNAMLPEAVPVLVMSSDDVTEQVEGRGYVFMQKPVAGRQLRRTLEDLLLYA